MQYIENVLFIEIYSFIELLPATLLLISIALTFTSKHIMNSVANVISVLYWASFNYETVDIYRVSHIEVSQVNQL